MARPKEFDPDEALEQAMHVFWAQGYHDTSIRDLVKATGVNQYGLYSTFEDKHGLFLAALDRYRDKVGLSIIRELKREGSGLGAIRRAFDRILEFTQLSNGHKGCLMCTTAVELGPFDEQAAAKVAENMGAIRLAFKEAIERAQRSGEIGEDRDAKALAEFLTTTVYSVGVLMRAGASRAYVVRHVQTALGSMT